MKLTIALVVLYGDSKQDAIQRAPSAAREIVLDRIAHGEATVRSFDALKRRSEAGRQPESAALFFRSSRRRTPRNRPARRCSPQCRRWGSS
jgi:hypothetical protein